jgi:tellurite resistance protein TerB
MSFLGKFFGTVAHAGASEIKKSWGKDENFLKAVTAGCALIVYADGTAEPAEIKKAMDVLLGNTHLSEVYPQRSQIEASLNNALSHATSASGRKELYDSLDKVSELPDAQNIADAVYLMAVDISVSNSRGAAGDDEKKVLANLAKHLHVDPDKFDFL